MSRARLALFAALVLAAGVSVPAFAERPDPAFCASARASSWRPASGTGDPSGELRIVAIQYKQDARFVEDYATFRAKMRCLVEDFVVPLRRKNQPMVVVFPEDVGLLTLGIGRRGALLRNIAGTPFGAPIGDAAPVGAAAALAGVAAAYAPQVAAYEALYGPIDPRKAALVAATDTFARAVSRTFSEIARDYKVWVVAANNQAQYRQSTDPAEVAVFADPEATVDPGIAFVATSARVTNTTFMWGPFDVHAGAPEGERNLLARNEKVPLTQSEKDLLALDEGPATGKEAQANLAGGWVAGFHLGFATSLPAFQFGYPFGQRPPGFRPCIDVRVSYVPCLEALGVDVVIQADANNGRWATSAQSGGWQPLEWMSSVWRMVADPTVPNIRYNVTPMMTGNLFDLAFDGQSTITRRGARMPGRRFVGTMFAAPSDPDDERVYAGDKVEFLAMAPWVVSGDDRGVLSAVGAALAPGSGDPRENDYIETAVYADLRLPPKRR